MKPCPLLPERKPEATMRPPSGDHVGHANDVPGGVTTVSWPSSRPTVQTTPSWRTYASLLTTTSYPSHPHRNERRDERQQI